MDPEYLSEWIVVWHCRLVLRSRSGFSCSLKPGHEVCEVNPRHGARLGLVCRHLGAQTCELPRCRAVAWLDWHEACCQSRDSARPYSTSQSPPRPSANHEAAIPDVARVSGCFTVNVSTPCFPLSERLAYDGEHGRRWTVDGRRRTGAIGERRRASSSTVGRWEHKIEEVPVDRLHRSSISSQLVHRVLA